MGKGLVRALVFSRQVNDWELGEVEILLQKLQRLVVSREVEDILSWRESKNDKFLVRSLYCFYSKGPRDPLLFSIV